jgi:hypothetical protein
MVEASYPGDSGGPTAASVNAGSSAKMAAAVYTVSTVNTQYKPGLVNGPAAQSRFRAPTFLCEVPIEAALQASSAEDLTLSAASSFIVADTGNNVLRLVILGVEGAKPGGWVSTFADSVAWMRPRGMCHTPQGLLVCDSGHHRIRCVSPDGKRVSPFAGCGKKGHKDGPVDKAQFDTPHSICVCPSDGSIIVADTGNHMLRRIQKGQVTTLAGGGVLGADKPGPGFVDGESSRYLTLRS